MNTRITNAAAITDAIRIEKDAIRSEARRRRAAITNAERITAAQALAGFSPALALPIPSPAFTIGAYLPIGTELNTEPLLRKLSAAGYRTALPRTVGATTPLHFVSWQPGEPLTSDLLGFPTPTGRNEVLPDLLLAPLTAFDATGNRLGQGAGFYDRTLAKLRRHNPQLLAIGIAFAAQEFPAIPTDAHDQRLNGILTERGYFPVL